MFSNSKKTAILLLTHLRNRSIEQQFSKILLECSSRFDVFFLCDNTDGIFDSYRGNDRFFLFNRNRLFELGYPGKSSAENLRRTHQNDAHHQRFNFDPGNVELPVLLFFKEHPEYERFWMIEYDVRFTGPWDRFLSAFEASDADLLGTTLTRHATTPNWYHWPSLDLSGKPIGKDRYIRGFFPIYRLSRRALVQLDRDYLDGVTGHFECLIPTLLHHAGMTIEDIGGDGEFVRDGNRNRFYRNTPVRGSLTPGTFVFRPVRHRPGDEPDTLWHPVRPSPFWLVVLRRIRRLFRQLAARVPARGSAAVATTTGDSLP
jgi:hypothetical protein